MAGNLVIHGWFSKLHYWIVTALDVIKWLIVEGSKLHPFHCTGLRLYKLHCIGCGHVLGIVQVFALHVVKLVVVLHDYITKSEGCRSDTSNVNKIIKIHKFKNKEFDNWAHKKLYIHDCTWYYTNTFIEGFLQSFWPILKVLSSSTRQ